jgi:serine/threonine-protein kinase
MQDLAGKTWGRFQIIEERGRGGMAAVYKAYDCVLQRTVALKILAPQLAANQEFTRRFRREAITSANLRHPNIVVIYDVGTQDQFQYIVMEFLEGQTLQEEIRQSGALPVDRILYILWQLSSALDYAHGQRLVHRDVKPANVILGKEDHVTLTDFGLVKAARGQRITVQGAAIGTLKYMSPEQAAGQELDHRSDIYSLGVVAYEMLSGATPFSGKTPYQTLHSLMHKPPPPLSKLNPQVSPGVEQAVHRALAKLPAERFGSAGDFVQALASAADLGRAVDTWTDTAPLTREIALILTSSDGREYPVPLGVTTVGRDIGNDIVLPVRQVSRIHARIRCDAASCHIVDMRSTNGTFINNAPLAPKKQRRLRPGDTLGIGPVVLTVARPSSPGQSGLPTASKGVRARQDPIG